MYLTILILQILDAVEAIEGWIESAVVDNEESPLRTAAGLVLALLFGLIRRFFAPLFQMSNIRPTDPGRSKRSRGDREVLEFHFDLHGRLLDVPPGAERIMGVRREAMLGVLFSRFLPERELADVVDAFIRVLRGEEVRDLRVRLRAAGNAWMPAVMDLVPVIRSGEIREVRGALRPLAQSPVREEKAESSRGASVYVFRKGEMLYVNSRFEQSSGYGRRDISAVDPMEIIHPADRLRVRRSNIGYLKGNPPEPIDFRIVTRDGRVRWVHARVRPILFKGQRAVLGNFVVMPAKEGPLRPSTGRSEGTAAPASYGNPERALAGHR